MAYLANRRCCVSGSKAPCSALGVPVPARMPLTRQIRQLALPPDPSRSTPPPLPPPEEQPSSSSSSQQAPWRVRDAEACNDEAATAAGAVLLLLRVALVRNACIQGDLTPTEVFYRYLRPYYLPSSFVLGSLTFGSATASGNFDFFQDVSASAHACCRRLKSMGRGAAWAHHVLVTPAHGTGHAGTSPSWRGYPLRAAQCPAPHATP